MKSERMRSTLGRCCVLLVLVCLASGAAAATLDLDARLEFNIPPQQLATALVEFSRQANAPVVSSTQQIDGLHSPGVSGSASLRDALRALLAETNLSYRVTDSGAIAVAAFAGNTAGLDAGKKEGKNGSSGGFRVAQVAQGAAPRGAVSATAQPGAAAGEKPGIEEIVVTAQKRTERLQEVPVPVTALSANVLVDSNQLRLQDYYSRVPGLNVAVNEFGAPQLTIRGLTTGGFTSPTVGVVVDDVPYGPSSPLAYGEEAPDIDPSDLARVEVLRGPQGTLYGASSLGGLLKYVTVDPSTDRLSGTLQAGTSATHNGNNPGYNVRGAINIPVTDTLAVRASAFTHEDPGYIDDPVRHVDAVNQARTSGARLSSMWKPVEDISLKVSALVQHSRLEGSATVDIEPGLGDLQQSNAAGSGGYDKKLQAYSATLTAKLGATTLTSISGYNINTLNDSFDYTPLFAPYTQYYFNVTGTPLFDHLTTRKFTQEVRLNGTAGNRFEWLVGVFYNHEKTTGTEDLLATNYFTGTFAGLWGRFIGPASFIDYAGFADLTWHVTDQFDIQVGGRESQNKQDYTETVTGQYALSFNGANPYIYPRAQTSENSFTYLVTPRYRLTPDLMIYSRLASGYRPGGPNTNIALGLPKNYQADKTQNYEIGVKGDALRQLLTFDASVYYIDWQDIQLRLTDPVSGETYFANGSRAKSQGVELSVEARPVTGMTLGAWVTWNDAELTDNFPAASTAAGGAYGVSGDRLPYGSRFSGNVSFDQQFVLPGSVAAFVGGVVSYVGEREGTFTSTPQRQTFPAYAKGDLHAGARYNNWTLNAFVSNVTDRRGLLGGGLGTYNSAAFTLIQPRTVGLTLTENF